MAASAKPSFIHLCELAAVKRKKTDPQKLASQAGRCLQRLKAHKYFTYQVDAAGRLKWARKEELITQETRQDGWFLLHTNEPAECCPRGQVLAHYKGLLDVARLGGKWRARGETEEGAAHFTEVANHSDGHLAAGPERGPPADDPDSQKFE